MLLPELDSFIVGWFSTELIESLNESGLSKAIKPSQLEAN
jgi:hypothetical protein